MCGFVGIFDIVDGKSVLLRKQLLQMSRKIRHRGPDWSGVFEAPNALISHERLAIIDPLSGKQPLYSPDGRYVLAVNGEIYNHEDLRKELSADYTFQTHSDCEVILPLYIKYGVDFLDKLKGIFAFALYDSKENVYFIGRDPIGVIPLYQGWDSDGHYYVASELKALEGVCTTIEEFLPGYYVKSGDAKPVKWYQRDWFEYENVKDNTTSIQQVRESLEAAVKRQMMSDVPYGVLLSGGLDSSVIAAIAAKFARRRVETGDTQEAWWPRLHSFAVGLQDSPDLVAARKAAEALGTVHHEIYFTIQEALDALPDVIYHLETYDITTVRASTPMFLMARAIKAMGIKMVLSGEGSDEIFGGYLYFHKAPNAREFHEETVRKLGKLHLYDCLRANKALAAWGVEGRVPFLDQEFLDVAMRVNPADKMCRGRILPPVGDHGSDAIEKWLLREAFHDMLPPEIVWRQKEQFSDGVGYSWIDTLKEMTSREVTDAQFALAAKRFPVNTPATKEEYYYRSIFSEFFPSESAAVCVPHEASVACSTAKALEWDEAFRKMNEPSGRAVAGVHCAPTAK
ncbi:MAG: asparagine synthase B [Victivallales bacterium]|nr:asparagine synthase B [Victivallales bacterium]